ncbi:MAG: hypothetical protein J2O48_02655 [Solirubrobacterales bacterium]|nr:hypothetical protein [Solirubrobacterales bacterium]
MRRVKTLLGTYAHTEPLKNGTVTPRSLEFEFIERSPVNTGFDAMIQRQAFEVSELPIGALFQAVAGGSPIRLLPVVVLGDFHHASLVYDSGRGLITPADLKGARVAVRSFSQTTGMWVRAILSEEHGLRVGDVTWVVTEPSHVAGFQDPGNVELAPAGETVASLLAGGAVDAAIMFVGRPGEPIRPVIPDPAAAAREWRARHGFVPINHMVAVSGALAADPAAVSDLLQAFTRAGQLAPARPEGTVPEMAAALKYAIDAAVRQGLIPAPLEVPELFAAGIEVEPVRAGEVRDGTRR